MMDWAEIIRKIALLAEKTGYVTFDQLNELLPQQGGPRDIEKLMNELSARGIQIKESDAAPSEPSCSFCGKPQTDVLQLIAGAATFICDECVQLCVGILGSQHPDWLERHHQFLATLPLKPGDL